MHKSTYKDSLRIQAKEVYQVEVVFYRKDKSADKSPGSALD